MELDTALIARGLPNISLPNKSHSPFDVPEVLQLEASSVLLRWKKFISCKRDKQTDPHP